MTNTADTPKLITFHVLYATCGTTVELLADEQEVPQPSTPAEVGTMCLARAERLASLHPSATTIQACELTDTRMVPVGSWSVTAGAVDRFDLAGARGTLVLE